MKVSGLFVYPVKGCRGVAVEAVGVGDRAMENDRRFMVIDADGTFITQRKRPEMAMIEASVSGDVLQLAAPGRTPLSVETRAEGDTRGVAVWDTPCDVVDQGDAVAAWLSAYLGTPARLVAMASGYRRPMPEKLPAEHGGRLTFADAAPLLIISASSLDDLNGRLATPLPMDRFRPNIVVTGCAAYAEDTWTRVRVGGIELDRLIPCGRCAVTTTDQATGERTGKEPLATLAGYRRDADFGVLFGSYYAHLGTGRLAVGDAVEVVSDTVSPSA